jgi:hypothetical protein
MTTSSATAAVRILPNNKVYRQLFEAQVRIEKKIFFIYRTIQFK